VDDVVDLYNLALNAVGARNNVASRTELSREAEVCELWFTVARDAVFAAAPWPELTKLAYLTVLNERDAEEDWVATNARPGYQFAYEAPRDMVRPQYLTNFDRFLVTALGDKQAIVSNTESAILAYTTKDLSPSFWSAGLKMAMVYALASHIVMPLSAKPARAKQAAEQANNAILQARETAANTSNETFDYLPDWIAARGFAGADVSQRFIYPVGNLLTVANV
jgi:hypothetical protein